MPRHTNLIDSRKSDQFDLCKPLSLFFPIDTLLNNFPIDIQQFTLYHVSSDSLNDDASMLQIQLDFSIFLLNSVRTTLGA